MHVAETLCQTIDIRTLLSCVFIADVVSVCPACLSPFIKKYLTALLGWFALFKDNPKY